MQTEPFRDVQEFDDGYLEITWAKRRKILDDKEEFYPDDALVVRDALIWLFRTRNIADPDDMEYEDLSVMLGRYPIVSQEEDLFGLVTEERLIALMTKIDTLLQEEVHEVSFYADDFHGKGTAFGETFNMHELTAAHRTFPHDTLVRVTNLENHQSVVVRINDRGPYIDGRDMDLSFAAFRQIADHSRGVIHARFERLGNKNLAGLCGDGETRYQKRITKAYRFHRGVPHTFPLGQTLALRANKWFVIRSIIYPDGMIENVQDWVPPEDFFSITPSMKGEYRFRFSTPFRHSREMRMNVIDCPKAQN
ncbi:hypothetical protein A3D11_01105 [Candidatus Peribacteria bacterium RIFCSPHIGHO2_02_FULL_49_16]|nr:MAG: hypothetical protein A2880_02835 [Candidatus Peribacteria bacterium RIFCSPHIGHO2_01_FULL_49_38]OGJ58720.1 MAG: hypothetical protein A3D11_01105 [Candidatus Peribacteria bacterium RIFCSPHIGHO2_02_FULL_49_16]